ncbi:hypothetical protein TWF718_006577 [Orbilia javanica]|uniref:Peptidase A1 domain-containing protein n=1 Tax=Orbilia javanica TaxID=47235 RepID=A0AAN8RHT9_9PEZI
MAPYMTAYLDFIALQTSVSGMLYAILLVTSLYLVDLRGLLGYNEWYSMGRIREVFAIKKRDQEIGENPEGWVELVVRYKDGVSGGVDNNVYTDVTFGEEKSPIELAVSFQQITWVPQLSGIKPPVDIPKDDIFRLEYGLNSTVSGYWTTSTLTASSVSITHTFGIATNSQNLHPTLGLGIFPTNRFSNRPSYLDSLLRQNKIFGKYVSFYDISNHSGFGRLVVGGIDRGKYLGRLKRLKGGGLVGIVESPGVMVSTGRNESFGVGGLAFLAVDTSFLWLPQPIVYNIISNFPVATYDLFPSEKQSFLVYTVPCGTRFDPSWRIEFTFEGVVVKVPLNHLVTTTEVAAGGRDESVNKRCVLAIQPNDGRYSLEGYSFSYVLGAPFWRYV